MSLIEVKNVSKEFEIFQRKKGLFSSLKSLIHREYTLKNAVQNISFNINEGELVGYIGSNGAGKSTTIKMLAGILLPTTGSIIVNGIEPWKDRKTNGRIIGTVFGQRSQLYWNLPMEETFDVYKRIYRIDNNTFHNNVEFYVDLLDMKSFLRTPVRQLSLGQRMRAELVVALLHDPQILYLDEPTIGLDLVVKKKIRKFIKKIKELKNTSVILTTHDMDDIEQICDRIITIDQGEIIYDGALEDFKNRFSRGHLIIVDFSNPNIVINDQRFEVIKEEDNKKWIQINKDHIGLAEAISFLSNISDIKDFRISEPNVEEAVLRLYKQDHLFS